MSIDYPDLVSVAGELSIRLDSEAMLRMAVNRYYYATLWLVRAAIIPAPRSRNAHYQARDELRRRTSASVGVAYQRLYELRVAADYLPREGQWDRKAIRARRLHEQIVSELQRRNLLSATMQ